MTADELAAKDAESAAKLVHTRDTEQQHLDADDLLCELLEACGFHKTVAAFRKLDKWYS